MKRLFIAIPIQLDKEFTHCVERLKQGTSNDRITWVQTHVQHLTLRFLGETPEGDIEPLMQALDNVFREEKGFDLKVDKLGVFGSHYKPTALWLGFSDFELLKNLHEKIEQALSTVGIAPDRGNFVPHITLGRVKNILDKNKFWNLFQQSQPHHQQKIMVNRVVLYQSKLHKDGPVYRELKSWPLE